MNSRLDQDLNLGIQPKEMARFRLRHPDEPLDQARTFILVDPHDLPDWR